MNFTIFTNSWFIQFGYCSDLLTCYTRAGQVFKAVVVSVDS